uniref:Aspergillus nuclease S1 n=1 Tax=Solanum chacoense TaxID=4108 RepID=A0A0V0GXC9_SOLCH
MGDIHQPMHVGFTSDAGGNSIDLRWFRHKSNLHHVWDREIILTAAKDYYAKDVNLLEEDIEGNFTDGIWSDDLASWRECGNVFSCVNKFATESINIACKWGYKGVEAGETLSDDYFNSRLPISNETSSTRWNTISHAFKQRFWSFSTRRFSCYNLITK